jgi:hypothetical protein
MKYRTRRRPISRRERSDARESSPASFATTDAAIETDIDPTTMIAAVGAGQVVGRAHRDEGLAGRGVGVADLASR